MIFVRTNLEVADNSGALAVRCIKILENKTIGCPGNVVLVSVRKINPIKKILKGSLQKAVLVRTRQQTKRSSGIITINDSAVVILNNNFLPIGTRIFGPVCSELRLESRFLKIISLAKYVV